MTQTYIGSPFSDKALPQKSKPVSAKLSGARILQCPRTRVKHFACAQNLVMFIQSCIVLCCGGQVIVGGMEAPKPYIAKGMAGIAFR